MKKFLALSVALSLVSAQAFAQTVAAPAAAAPAAPAAAAPAAAAPAVAAPLAGLSNAALVAIGVTVAATAAVVADNSNDATTTHSTTSHK